MSQHDLDIANQGFPATRADINNALQALGSSNSGATAPSTTYANQLWYDTANNIIKIRNEDNDAWISLFTLDQTNDNIEALTIDGSLTVDGGSIKLDGNYPTGTGNVALGDTALDDGSLSGANNTAIGSAAMTAHTSGNNNTAVGHEALTASTTGFSNVTVGGRSLDANTTGAQNSALGYQALSANTTANNNVAVGYQSAFSNTTGSSNTALGFQAGYTNTTGSNNVAVGNEALLFSTTASNNTALGYQALTANTTGTENVSCGTFSLDANTTASNNVGIGRHALGGTTTGGGNTAVGDAAGISNQTGTFNVYVGGDAGSVATGGSNTFVGRYAGGTVTSGEKNTILGRFNGNQGGVDIRTSNNIIVLSDGDGNPRMLLDNDGRCRLSTALGATAGVLSINNIEGSAHCLDLGTEATANDTLIVFKHATNSDGSGGNEVGSVRVTASGTSYNTTSDHRLKENVTALTSATTRLKQLNPLRFNFIRDAETTVDGFLAHEVQNIVPEAISGTYNEVDDDGNPVYQSIDQSKLVPLLVATIQELEARITALEAE